MSLYKIRCRSGCRSQIWDYKPITEKLYKNVARNVAQDVARKHTPPIHIKKAAHTRVLLLGMVIVNKKAIKDPKVHFRGKEIY